MGDFIQIGDIVIKAGTAVNAMAACVVVLLIAKAIHELIKR